jgi:hypothetical protein
MSIPATREDLKQYALRALGKPVIEINVDDDQLEDRLDEALQIYAQYHTDGIRRTYLKYQLTAQDKIRLNSSIPQDETATSSDGFSTKWYEAQNFLVVPPTVLSVVNIFPFSNKMTMNFFDVRYQLRLNDLYDFASTSMISYDMVLRHLDFLDQLLVGMKPIRFTQHDNRLYVDMDWNYDIQVNDFFVIDCWRKLDPSQYPDVYNDMWLKRYVTSKFKQQWGANLIKFDGVVMLGGVKLNGEKIFTDALAETEKLEKELRETFENPPAFLVG